ncbi:MAG: adenosylhomocysteinase [Armatimonadota bacterium]|nr:adenosylhomocysteinase [Armatimonadota bacterium]MDR7569364.1 adenosylhomocysteinase [Armatimonadota bacterium]MDR7614513.1 adenosylhomocysteinase [Armatimonadota bacterium]
MRFEIRDPTLASVGRDRIAWAEREMPVLRQIRERFARERPLSGFRIAACLHVTSETAALVRTLMAGGGEVALCASNPLSTQDEVAAALAEEGVQVFAVRGEDRKTYYRHIQQVLEIEPHLTLDDGADLVTTLHRERTDLLEGVVGGTEETTTGVLRLRAMAREGVLRYPIVAVNDAKTKHWFDNRYGTGQSALDGILRATNLLLAGRKVVVCGYGACGRGVAARARGLGAHVIVTEVDPLPALEAVMDGFAVMPSLEAARVGEVFVTVTGNRGVLRREHFEEMRDGAVLANAGHFNVEIDLEALQTMSVSVRRVREHVDEYTLPDGRRLYVLAEGRLVNLAAAEGHPAAVMDMSFANQALCVEWLVRAGRGLSPQVYPVPEAIDRQVAALKLRAMGVRIDELTPEQRAYLESWREGT